MSEDVVKEINQMVKEARAVSNGSTLSEAQLSGADLKRRLNEMHSAARKDIAHAEGEITRINRIIEEHEFNVAGLSMLRDEAKERLLKIKFAIARMMP